MSQLNEEMEKIDTKQRYTALFSSLRRKYTEAKAPLRGTFELTPHCTLDCKMCYVHASGGKYPHRVLTGDEWINIMDDAVDAGMLYAALTGGECFFHPDFKRIYTHLRKRGVFISLLSNGTLMDKATVDWLKAAPPNYIQISVYGSSPEAYEKVTGRAEAFFLVDQCLSLLESAGMIPRIALTISRYNIDDFENILDYLKTKKHGKITVNCELMEAREETGKKFEDFALTVEEQARVWETFFRVEGIPYSPFCAEDPDIDPYLINTDKKESILDMPCVAGMCAFSVTYGGHMKPCLQLPLTNMEILKEGFSASWKEICRAGHEYRRSRECADCDYLNNCMFCPGMYALETGGKDGLPGLKPCNKTIHMLPTIISKPK